MKITTSIIFAALSLYAIFGCTKQTQPVPEKKSKEVVQAEKALFLTIEQKKKELGKQKTKIVLTTPTKPKTKQKDSKTTANYKILQICGIP